MPVTVRLEDIIDALQMPSDEQPWFLDLDSGEVHMVTADLLRKASDREEPDFLPDWQKDEWVLVQRIDFISLPDPFEIHEWAIMQDFANSVRSERLRSELLDAIHGAGAFRHFKAAIRRHNCESAWYDFRAQALRRIAIDWCEKNGLAWEEEKPSRGRGQ